METPTTSQNTPMYSTIASQQTTPKLPVKEQAIIFSSINGAKLQDYLLQLGPLVQPKNIIYSSRISNNRVNNRVCVYLSRKAVVDDFLNKTGSIKINNEVLLARRLVTPSERLLLSNVHPTIPQEMLINILQNLGLKLMSPITCLRIGATNPEYSHILSFRRQVYIEPLDNITIPDFVMVDHDNVSYKIFLSNDQSLCFKCKQNGHLASQCSSETSSLINSNMPNTIPTFNPPQSITSQIPTTDNQTNNSSSPLLPINSMEVSNISLSTTETSTSTKRHLSETPSPTEEPASNIFNEACNKSSPISKK
uniref:Uncharacterized protein LOC114324327 n=1 Tax=Diabrotica virgifera virgifera TaxID=50390 RepID=A0A6P7F1Y5_DIAVI